MVAGGWSSEGGRFRSLLTGVHRGKKLRLAPARPRPANMHQARPDRMAEIEFAGWTGTGRLHLRLSLVTCPVAISEATNPKWRLFASRDATCRDYRHPECLQSHFSSVRSAASLECSLQYLPRELSFGTRHLHAWCAHLVDSVIGALQSLRCLRLFVTSVRGAGTCRLSPFVHGLPSRPSPRTTPSSMPGQ